MAANSELIDISTKNTQQDVQPTGADVTCIPRERCQVANYTTYLSAIANKLPCHSKWQYSIQAPCPFLIRHCIRLLTCDYPLYLLPCECGGSPEHNTWTKQFPTLPMNYNHKYYCCDKIWYFPIKLATTEQRL